MSWSQYSPAALNEAVVVNAVGVPKVTVPGPCTTVQLTGTFGPLTACKVPVSVQEAFGSQSERTLPGKTMGLPGDQTLT